jgi:hypothetical protein
MCAIEIAEQHREHWLFSLLTVKLTGSYSSLPLPVPWQNIILHIASLGNDCDSTSEAQMLLNIYYFCMIPKSKS